MKIHHDTELDVEGSLCLDVADGPTEWCEDALAGLPIPCSPELSKTLGELHAVNKRQWDAEDRVRRAGDGEIPAIKREIDTLNSLRHRLIERADRALEQAWAVNEEAPPLTESIGSALDRLSVLTLRIVHAQRLMEGPVAAKRNAILCCQRDDLVRSIAVACEDLVTGRRRAPRPERMKLYGAPSAERGQVHPPRREAPAMTGEARWDLDGFPSWRASLFLCPDGGNADALVELVRRAVDEALKHQGAGPVYPSRGRVAGRFPVGDGCLPDRPVASEAALSQLRGWLAGSVKVHHPMFAKNIVPPPSFAHLAAWCAVSLFMPNGVTGEDAAETLSAELACARALARLAGYDPDRAGGLFTFGGTATNLYAIKVGIAKAQPDHTESGLEPGLAVVGSWPAHYSQKSACAWLGIGTRNYLAAASLPDQTTDLASMEAACREVLARGRRLACIVGAGGTTSNMAVDDFAAIAAMRDRLVAEYGLDYAPHVHADTVVGWAYLCFVDYDLQRNPLGFSPRVVAKLARLVDRLTTVRHADSFGTDFHKTGFAPYTSSMIVMRDGRDFSRLRRDGGLMAPLFHDKDAYNPGTFTLETSRSAANMVATWVGLQVLGKQGMRRLLGHALETAEAVRRYLDALAGRDAAVINERSYGPDVFVRCYPPGDPAAIEENFSDTSSVRRINQYTSELFAWLSRQRVSDAEQIAVSKTSAAFYTSTGEPVVALRLYSLNPYFSDVHARELVVRLLAAKRRFDAARPEAGVPEEVR